MARGDNSHLQLRVNLVGSPARKGLVHIEQTFGHDVGTVFGPGWVEYEPGQNMVDSYISIVSFKRGTIGIKAWVTNYGTPDSVALTTVEVY